MYATKKIYWKMKIKQHFIPVIHWKMIIDDSANIDNFLLKAQLNALPTKCIAIVGFFHMLIQLPSYFTKRPYSGIVHLP